MRFSVSEAGRRISASSIVGPCGREWSSGTSAVAHWKPGSQASQSSFGTGGVAPAAVGATASTSATMSRKGASRAKENLRGASG